MEDNEKDIQELLSDLKKLRKFIIKQEGYQEMADGCDQAIAVVEFHFGIPDADIGRFEDMYGWQLNCD